MQETLFDRQECARHTTFLKLLYLPINHYLCNHNLLNILLPMNNTKRIDAADALRGFSILGICLLHCIEHFNFYSYPEITSVWLKFTDTVVWDSLFFAFGGKAYAIFALLFGFSFFIQNDNQTRKGQDFRLRFAWRLVLLFIWGNLNAMFFTAEVLVLFALMGFLMIPLSSLNNKYLLVIAAICILQPVEWAKVIYALANPVYEIGESLDSALWVYTVDAQKHANFLEMAKVNLWYGQLASLAWAWENGRCFQVIALFILGLVIGRKKLFAYSEKHIRQWGRWLVAGVLCFFPLYGLADTLPGFIENKAVLKPLLLIVQSLAKFSFMVFLMALVILAFYTSVRGRKWLSMLIPIGKMSLTAYITQSIIGSFVFYNWGLGLYDRLGITYSFLVGIGIFILQYLFARWWMKTHRHGPLEYVWKKATWYGSKL